MNNDLFELLKFNPHWTGTGVQALHFFKNGYGVSVVNFKGAYVSSSLEFELAVIKGDEKHFKVSYDTPITDDVLRYLKRDDVSKIMSQVKELP